MKKNRLIITIGLLTYLAIAIFLILSNPQPFGKIALIPIAIGLLVNYMLNKKVLRQAILGFVFVVGAFIMYSGLRSYWHNESNAKEIFNAKTPVQFSHASFNASLKKAEANNKYVFVDFYTVWCKPCIIYSKEVLTDPEVAEFMNEAFINVKYNAYEGEGIDLKQKYGVMSFPTFLVLDANGKVIETHFSLNKDQTISLAKKYL